MQPSAPLPSTEPNVVIDSLGGNVTPEPDSSRATIVARPRRAAPREEPVDTVMYERQREPVPVENPSAFDLMGVSPIPLREGRARLDSISRRPRDTTRLFIRRDSIPRIDSIPAPIDTFPGARRGR
jgi:hypothetical protein